MPLRWIRTRTHKPSPQSPNWGDDDWLFVDDQQEVLARTYKYEPGPQADRWFWGGGGQSGVADNFESARQALKARMIALGKVPP